MTSTCFPALSNLPTECLDTIVSFVSTPSDLCVLDATSRNIQSLTDKYWSQNAMEKFGIQPNVEKNINNGKAAWRKGVALTCPNRNLYYEFQIEPIGVALSSATSLACNSNTIVGVCDNWEHISDEERYEGNDAIIFRDAKTLKQLAILDPPEMSRILFNITLAGAPGPKTEIVAATRNRCELAMLQQNGYYREYDLRNLFPNDASKFVVDNHLRDLPELKILGCVNHLVAYAAGKLFLLHFDGNLPMSETNELTPIESFEIDPIEKVIFEHNSNNKYCHSSLSWGSNELPGTLVLCSPGKISVWHLNDATSELKQIQIIENESVIGYDDLAMNKRYIVGSVFESRTLHIFDRNENGGQKIGELVDPGDIGNATRFERAYSPSMQFCGDLIILVHANADNWPFRPGSVNNSIGVWNIRSQSFVKIPRTATRGDNDIASMIRVDGDGYTCFVTHSYDRVVETVWGFPESDEGLLNLQRIVRNHTVITEPIRRIQISRKRKASQN